MTPYFVEAERHDRTEGNGWRRRRQILDVGNPSSDRGKAATAADRRIDRGERRDICATVELALHTQRVLQLKRVAERSGERRDAPAGVPPASPSQLFDEC
jgi:hypothetical protein